MPNTDAAKKTLRSDAKKRTRNTRRKRTMKELLKEVRKLADAGDAKAALAKLPAAYKAIDKAVKDGVIKKNTASRKKSRLTRLIAKQSE